MNITTEFILFWLAVVGPLLTGMLILSNKLEQIWRAISRIEKDYVGHDVCQSRRDRCPCTEDIKELKEELKIVRGEK